MTAATPTVVVVGAGFGGIAAGVMMKRAGIHSFTIYESSLGAGGTWWDNTYPGAEVDVGSHLYCFSFKPHEWTRTHARQPELQKYLEETVDQFGIRPHLRLGVTVESATWNDTRHEWSVQLGDGAQVTCRVLISAVGFLNVPRYPDWPGLDEFGGPKFHTARWEHQHDLTGKVVAVVGTGSSATQIVPALQPIVERLYLFQREPGWVLPKGEHDFDDDERAAFSSCWRRRRERWRLKYLLEKNLRGGAIWRPGTKANTAREEMCRRYIERQFKDHPELRELVTPTYPYPGKRPIFASTFYPSLKKTNVTPRAFLGITVPGFPNFFMLYGPGTNGGDIVSMLEAQAAYAVRAIKRIARGRVTVVEVRPRFEAAWYRWLQAKMVGTSWTMSNNYFTSASGKVVTQWPYGNLSYTLLTKLLGRVSETAQGRGGRSHE